MAAGREVGRRGELQAAATGSSSRRALLSRDPVLFLAAQERPVGCVWRGADPQARPRSAIDCSAFPINYSLIMENRRHWLHGSGSSSHVAVPVRGQARRACTHLPAPASLLAARGVASSPRLPPALQSWPAGQGPGTETFAMRGVEMGAQGRTWWCGDRSRACRRGQLISARGTIGSLLI